MTERRPEVDELRQAPFDTAPALYAYNEPDDMGGLHEEPLLEEIAAQAKIGFTTLLLDGMEKFPIP